MIALAVALQAVGVAVAVLGCYSAFRTVVLDLRGQLSAGEGNAFMRMAALQLGVATAVVVAGRALEASLLGRYVP